MIEEKGTVEEVTYLSIGDTLEAEGKTFMVDYVYRQEKSPMVQVLLQPITPKPESGMVGYAPSGDQVQRALYNMQGEERYSWGAPSSSAKGAVNRSQRLRLPARFSVLWDSEITSHLRKNNGTALLLEESSMIRAGSYPRIGDEITDPEGQRAGTITGLYRADGYVLALLSAT